MWSKQTFRRLFQDFDRFLWLSIKGYEKFVALAFFLIDLVFGSPFYRTILRIAFGPISVTIFACFVGLCVLFYFDLIRPQDFKLAKLRQKWTITTERPKDLHNLSQSTHHSDLSLSFGSLINYKHSFDANTSLSQKPASKTENSSERPEGVEKTFSSMNSLLSKTSPYSRTICTEGHYSSLVFADQNANSTTEDVTASSKSNWSGNFSKKCPTPNQSTDYSGNKSWTAEDQENNKKNAEDRMKSNDDPLLLHLFNNRDDSYYSVSPSSLSDPPVTKKNVDSSSKNEGKSGRLSFLSARIHRIGVNDPVYIDLMRYSMNLKLFINKNVLKPLILAIDQVNRTLLDNHATFTVGNSSVELLQLAMEQKSELRVSKIPFLIPYLRVHVNQAYLIYRINQLTRNFAGNEKYDALKEQQNQQIDLLKTTNGWNTPTLSDSELVFKLFGVYLDMSMAKRCLVNHPDRPFTSMYVLKEPAEPSVVQSLPHSFYIHVRTKEVVMFDFVTKGGKEIYTAPTGEDNVFVAFSLLLIFCKQNNGGYLGDMLLNKAGLDLISILD